MDRDSVFPWVTYALKYYSHSIFFNINLAYVPWSYSMSIDHIMSEICNSNIREVILIGDSTILLNYGHQFMESLHVVDSRS